MKRLLAGLAISAMLLTGCGSIAPSTNTTQAQTFALKGSNQVFVTFENAKGRLTPEDVTKVLEARGAEVKTGPFVLDVVPYFGGTPEKLQILSVAGKNVNVYVYTTEAEATKAFEGAKNPATADRATDASTHFVVWGNLLVTTELDLLPLIGNCQPDQAGKTEGCAPYKIDLKLID